MITFFLHSAGVLALGFGTSLQFWWGWFLEKIGEMSMTNQRRVLRGLTNQRPAFGEMCCYLQLLRPQAWDSFLWVNSGRLAACVCVNIITTTGIIFIALFNEKIFPIVTLEIIKRRSSILYKLYLGSKHFMWVMFH